jgi:ADP-heptose:LPS heptosyltransferase
MAELARKLERTAKHALWGAIGLISASKSPPSLPLNFASACSVLVIRPDRLGDVVLSTPVYESIKKSFPHLRVSALVNQANVSILADNPNIEEIISFDPKSPFGVIKQLRHKKFDIVFTLNKKFSATASLLALISKTKYRVGYAHDETTWLYDVRVALDNQPRHESLNNLELLHHVGITQTAERPRLYFNEGEEKKIEDILKESRQHPERPLLLIKPGTRIVEWGWKLENFRIVAEKLSNLQKAEVFFICAPGEETLIDKVNEGTNIHMGRLPILSIKELALAIKKSDLLFCNHTGIMHLASAVKTPVAVIFKHGETARWAPVHTRHVLLEERNPNTLSPETVIENIDRLLKNIPNQNNDITEV